MIIIAYVLPLNWTIFSGFQKGGIVCYRKFKMFVVLELCNALVARIMEDLMVKVYLLLLLLGIQMLYVV